MFTSSKTMVGLDVGSSTIKAVELTKSGKSITVTGFGQLDVDGTDPAAVASGIADLMREGGFKTNHVVSKVSGQKVIVRFLSMAPMSDEELRNAILFEAEKYIPFTLDECVMDCQRLDGPASGDSAGTQSNVLLVAATKSHVSEQLSVLREAGITPDVVDVDAFAIANAWSLSRTFSRDEEDAESATAIVDIGGAKTSVNVMVGGTSLFTREIQIGGRAFTQAIARKFGIDDAEAEGVKRSPGDNADAVREAVFPTIDDLGNELVLSFDYFENQCSKKIQKILLSGGAARFDLVRESFEKIFERPTAVFNPFEGMPVADDLDQDLLAAGSPQLVVAAGLASRILKG